MSPAVPARVLVVEDGALNRKVILHMLSKLHCETVAVEDGKEAVELIESGEKFDLVLMDLQLPVMKW